MKKYYVNYDEVSEEEFCEQLEGCVNEYASENYDDLIDESYEPYQIEGTTFNASTILKKCDPVAYRCGQRDYESSLLEDAQYELENYGSYEINGDTFEIEEEEEEEE